MCLLLQDTSSILTILVTTLNNAWLCWQHSSWLRAIGSSTVLRPLSLSLRDHVEANMKRHSVPL